MTRVSPVVGTRGGELQDVLPAVGAIEEQLPAVGRPGDAVDVVADDGVVERLAVADVDLRRLLRRHVVHEQIDDRVRRARLGVGLDVVLALELGLIELEVDSRAPALVEPVVGDLRAVGRPPHRGRLRQLLAVDPARRAVLDAVLLAAVGGDRRFAAAGGVAEPEIAVAVEGLQLPVRRIRGGRLPAALDARRPARRGRSRPVAGAAPISVANFAVDVVAIQLAVPGVVERLAIASTSRRAHRS